MGRFHRGLSAFLAAAMLACGSTVSFAASDSVLVRDIEEVAEDYKLPDEFLEELDGQERLPLAEFWQSVANHNLSVEFMQRFTEEYYVYKKGSAYHFQALDPSIPRNSYDWSNLVRNEETREIRYVVDGENHGVKGIDISSYQGDINWEKVRADGVRFAFIRLGYRGYGTGVMMTDQYFEKNYQEAREAGVQVGVYFYSQAVNMDEAKEEADYVLDVLDGRELDFPIAFDIEGAPNSSARTASLTPAATTNIVKAFCNRVEAKGYDTILYTYSRYLFVNMEPANLQGYKLWLAQYYKVPYYPYRFQIWQYSSKGRVNGINGDVDLNVMFQ